MVNLHICEHVIDIIIIIIIIIITNNLFRYQCMTTLFYFDNRIKLIIDQRTHKLFFSTSDGRNFADGLSSSPSEIADCSWRSRSLLLCDSVSPLHRFFLVVVTNR